MALLNQLKNSYAICTWLPMLKVALKKPGLIYSERERKNWIIYHRHLMLCSYMLCVRIINPRYSCTLISGVLNHYFVDSPESSGGWLSMGIGLAVVWSTIRAVPNVFLELVACVCLTKCKSSACKNSKTQICTPACGCNAENCCNPTSWGVVYYYGPKYFGDVFFSILF